MLATRNKQVFKNILSFRLDLQYYWVLTVDISGIAGFEKLAMTAAVKGGKGAGGEQTNERAVKRESTRNGENGKQQETSF